jgi:hypothetical protein
MFQKPPESSSPRPTLPPRPNLGPEFIPEPRTLTWLWVLSLSVLGAVGLLAFLWLRARNRRDRRSLSVPPESTSATPRIHAAGEIRRALVERFGAEFLARTTEELREDARLREQLGSAVHAQAVEILAAADLEKFGDKFETNLDPFDLSQRLASLLASIRAGAISSKSGRWSEPTSGPRRRATTEMSSETKA